MSNGAVYNLKGVRKVFEGPTEPVEVLKNIDLDVDAGESLAVIGASGSGKTTLLHILGTLDIPDSGNVFFMERDLAAMKQREKAVVRNREIGFVFQFHHLLAEFTTLENVAMPGLIAGIGASEARQKAREALSLVGLEQRTEHSVTTLSGGERQRAAIARAILLKPRVLLADEPTGSLDERTGGNVAELLARLNRELNMTMVVVTHNQELARLMGRRMELRTGELYAC